MDNSQIPNEIDIDQEIHNLEMMIAELNGQKALLARIRDNGFEIRKKVIAGEAEANPEVESKE